MNSLKTEQILETHPADLQPTDESHILIDCYFQDLTDVGLILPLNISYFPADRSQMTHNETGICVTVLKSLQHFRTSITVK